MFSSIVVGTDGFLRAQWPLPQIEIWSRRFDFRDYFRGARALAEGGQPVAYVARAFRSGRDGEMKFGVSMPLLDGSRWVGVLTAIVATDSLQVFSLP